MNDDLISRAAAIDVMLAALDDDWESDYAKDRMCELPSAQPEQRWVPCSERLPEKIGFYLTTTKDKAVYCDYWNEDNFDRTEMVIAWMPLPEPYREGRWDE